MEVPSILGFILTSSIICPLSASFFTENTEKLGALCQDMQAKKKFFKRAKNNEDLLLLSLKSIYMPLFCQLYTYTNMKYF